MWENTNISIKKSDESKNMSSQMIRHVVQFSHIVQTILFEAETESE